MGSYFVQALHPNKVKVTQSAFFPLTLGAIVFLAACSGFYFLATDSTEINRPIFWMLLLTLIGSFLGGIYLSLLHPFKKESHFLVPSENIILRDQSLLRSTDQNLTHQGIDTFTVQISDGDGGYWFTPTLLTTKGNSIQIGFGCSTKELADAVIADMQEVIGP